MSAFAYCIMIDFVSKGKKNLDLSRDFALYLVVVVWHWPTDQIMVGRYLRIPLRESHPVARRLKFILNALCPPSLKTTVIAPSRF